MDDTCLRTLLLNAERIARAKKACTTADALLTAATSLATSDVVRAAKAVQHDAVCHLLIHNDCNYDLSSFKVYKAQRRLRGMFWAIDGPACGGMWGIGFDQLLGGARYWGTIVDDAHGCGLLETPSFTYIGGFLHGTMHGHGTYTSRDFTHTGHFAHNSRVGWGEEQQHAPKKTTKGYWGLYGDTVAVAGTPMALAIDSCILRTVSHKLKERGMTCWLPPQHGGTFG